MMGILTDPYLGKRYMELRLIQSVIYKVEKQGIQLPMSPQTVSGSLFQPITYQGRYMTPGSRNLNFILRRN